MNRRRYLSSLAVGGLGAIAGCTGGTDGGGTDGGSDGGTTVDETTTTTGDTTDGTTPTDATTGTTPTDATTTTGGGTTTDPGTGGGRTGDLDLPIERSQLARGAPKNAIPAVTSPEFAPDWGPVEFSLNDDDEVIGVERDGRARAYPIRILDWHEIVNDTFDGPLLVTFCPLCGSGMTAVRTVNGEETLFGVSGYLYQSDLVMYDEATDSLWSQILATAINGPKTGERLELVPSAITTWGTWRADHPDTEVLLPPPKSDTIVEARPRNYDQEPYSGYDDSRRIGIGRNDFDDDRLHPKTQVIGVSNGGESVAYPYDTVVDEGVINDDVGGLPVVVAATEDGTLVAYDRRVDGATLTFEPGDDRHMRAGGSRWQVSTGRAVDGPHQGTRLSQASSATTMFWFAWLDFNEDTTVYGREASGRLGGR